MFDRESLKLFYKKNKDPISAFYIMVLIVVVFAAMQNDFLTKYGPQSMFNQVITLCIAVFAQTIIIVNSEIDLSLGAAIGLTNAVAAMTMQPLIDTVGNAVFGVSLTVVLVILVGGLIGAFNGVFVVYGKMQSIIVTLATSSVITGIAVYVCPIPGGTIIRSYTRFLTGRAFDVIPVSALILLFFIFGVWMPFRRTRLCQSIYAVGGNRYSAYVSGINVNRVKMMTFIIAGMVSGVAGLLLTAQTASGDPLGASLFTINSIAAVILGGALFSGGKGTYIGSVAGAVIISLVLGLLIFLEISSYYQDMVQGLILVLAIGIRFVQARRAENRLLLSGN